MLKANTKQAMQNIKNYIMRNFDCTNYTETAPEGFSETATFILKCFRSEKYSTPEDFRYYHNVEIAAFRDWCAGLPSVLDTCYFYNRSALDDLGEILEQSETEKAKYTETQAENTLTDLIYRELTRGCK